MMPQIYMQHWSQISSDSVVSLCYKSTMIQIKIESNQIGSRTHNPDEANNTSLYG